VYIITLKRTKLTLSFCSLIRAGRPLELNQGVARCS